MGINETKDRVCKEDQLFRVVYWGKNREGYQKTIKKGITLAIRMNMNCAWKECRTFAQILFYLGVESLILRWCSLMISGHTSVCVGDLYIASERTTMVTLR